MAPFHGIDVPKGCLIGHGRREPPMSETGGRAGIQADLKSSGTAEFIQHLFETVAHPPAEETFVPQKALNNLDGP